MRRKAIALAATATLLYGAFSESCLGAAVSVKQDEAGVTIGTQLYEVRLGKAKGYTIESLTDRRAKRKLPVQISGLIVFEERERAEWSKAYFGAAPTHREAAAAAECEVRQGDDAVTCTVRWSNPAVEVERTMTFRASPVIDNVYRVRALKPLEQIAYSLEPRDTRLSTKGVFHPGAKRFVCRMPEEASFKPAPGYVYCRQDKTGVGLICDGAVPGVGALAFGVLHPSWRRIHVGCYSEPLRWRKPPFEVTLSAGIVIGSDPAGVAALYRKRNPRLKPVEIAELELDRLIHRADEKGRARITLRSNADTEQSVVLAPSIEGGIADRRDLAPQTITLPPFADKALAVEWDNQGEYGFELLATVRGRNGQALDAQRRHFAVADHYLKVAQTTVWNAGWMRYDWLIPAQIEQAKKNHVGIIEYYCWAPDQVFDLTPDTEKWEPHTESQGSYRTELTRTFLKTLVATAHGNGLRVLAMDTGFASLHGALAHPDRVKYTGDGQIYLYNGNIHDGRRFNAVGAHMFEPEYVQEWAEEMCASVDMFGWDGVRFDWGFIPIAQQDPLYVAEVAQKNENIYAKARRTAWYTFDGNSAHDLYADPDQTAADLCALYRRTIAQKLPNFTYNGNYSVNHGLVEEYPKYSKENCTDSGILMESLLNTATTYPTWQEWAGVLTSSMRIVRPFRSQPFVGWMRGYAPDGVAHRNIHYIMMASGFRWYGPAGPRHSLDSTYKRFRHATRFSEFFYDTNFTPRADGEELIRVAGEGADRILWKPFVFERRRERDTDVMVHMINLPKEDHIIMHHELPAPKRNLTVTVTVDARGRSPTAWLLVPDPHPHAEPLTCAAAGPGKVTVNVPELASLGTVVLRLKGGE